MDRNSSNQSTSPITPSPSIPQIAIANNNCPVLKQERNSSKQIGLLRSSSTIVLTASQNSMANILLFLNIKKENNLCTNVRESNSSDQADSVNSNKSTLANEPCDLMAEQNPIFIANNNNVSIIRETPYFCIRKLPNIKNVFCHGDNDQTSQDNIIFICRICKNSPSSDIHSFALHMSDHSECNMHECIVCDKKFNSVILWVDHMSYHQQQIDLNVSTIQFDPMGTESNASLDPIKTRNTEPQVLKNLRNSDITRFIQHIQNKNNIVAEVNDEPQIEHNNDSVIIHSPVDGNSSGTNSIDIEHLWFPCDVCEKKFSIPFQLNVHRKSHFGIVPYVCKICNKTYQLKYQWDQHFKDHYKKQKANLKSKQHTNNLESNITKLNIESISHKDKMNSQYCKKEYNSISQGKKHMTMSRERRRHCKSNLPELTSSKATKNSTKSGLFRGNICMKTYNTSYNRSVHTKNVHKVIDSTYLNTYDHTGLQKDKLIDKIQQKPAIKKRNIRNQIKGTKCGLCDKTYSNLANLSCHKSIIHSQTFEPMTCNVCGSTFKHKYSYREHLKIKHKQLFKHYEETNSTYKKIRRQIISVNKINIMKCFCKICKMKFADNITLQEHSKIHTLNMYKCNDCGQQFETNLTLGTHILENHSTSISTSNKNEHVENYGRQNTSLEIMNYNFAQCEICLKILKTPKYLRLHMRLHTGVKPFKCDKCNKAFRFKSNLKVHQKKDLACYTP